MRRIQDINQLVVETFQDRASKVCVWIDDERDRAKIRSPLGAGRHRGGAIALPDPGTSFHDRG